MTLEPSIRKYVTYAEEILQERGEELGSPVRRAWAAAVIEVADKRINQMGTLSDLGEMLGQKLGEMALSRLGQPDGAPIAYGKSAIIGSHCEIEHGAALLHPKLGKPLRALIGQGKALIPSSVKRGGPGRSIDVPLHGADNEWDFTMLDAIEAMIPDAPRDGEVVVVVALAVGGRAGAVIGK
ncbi:amino acid synthesis family protein [Orrella marina]|uniref:Peptide synthetase n=1 Tax=Orrella marina TaxID=2163011 RepID=A0A2R4XK53_9BURK|nr:amino acid synthesis family protein [Orrella marina]AWB34144.1 peptide synthetase [Orrella marina]